MTKRDGKNRSANWTGHHTDNWEDIKKKTWKIIFKKKIERNVLMTQSRWIR